MTRFRPLFWILILLMIVFTVVTYDVKADIDIMKLKEFLDIDKTDEHEYLPWYTCGHYSRGLARNASKHNLTIGSVILSDHPVFRGYNNHIMNYVVDNTTIILIEPQTDRILALNQTMYTYYHLYPNGVMVPTYWNYNMAHTGMI